MTNPLKSLEVIEMYKAEYKEESEHQKVLRANSKNKKIRWNSYF